MADSESPDDTPRPACAACGAPGEVFITEVQDGEALELSLCNDCYAARGLNEGAGAALHHLIASAGAEPQRRHVAAASAGAECPACGFSAADLKRSARAGCPECYQTFRAQLLRLARNMQPAIEHKGKRPDGAPPPPPRRPAAPRKKPAPKRSAEQRAAKLAEALARAVADENYERAAELRDAIRSLDPPAAPAQA